MAESTDSSSSSAESRGDPPSVLRLPDRKRRLHLPPWAKGFAAGVACGAAGLALLTHWIESTAEPPLASGTEAVSEQRAGDSRTPSPANTPASGSELAGVPHGQPARPGTPRESAPESAPQLLPEDPDPGPSLTVDVAAAPPAASTALVDEALARNPPSSVEPGEPAALARREYAVQMASVRSRARASSERDRLSSQFPSLLGGTRVEVVQTDLGPLGSYFRVRAGPATKEEATHLCAALRGRGQDCLVVQHQLGHASQAPPRASESRRELAQARSSE